MNYMAVHTLPIPAGGASRRLQLLFFIFSFIFLIKLLFVPSYWVIEGALSISLRERLRTGMSFGGCGGGVYGGRCWAPLEFIIRPILPPYC